MEPRTGVRSYRVESCPSVIRVRGFGGRLGAEAVEEVVTVAVEAAAVTVVVRWRRRANPSEGRGGRGADGTSGY